MPTATPTPSPTLLTVNLVGQLAFGLLAMTICLPSMQEWGAIFGASQAAVQLSFSGFVVAYGCLQLLYGPLSDRLGRRPLILGGWAVYATVYLGFALSSAEWHAWALFVVYGLYFGATEGTEKALVADLVPAERRGTAFGWFNAALGLGALPASVVFGLVWERSGPEVAFVMGAGIAAVATLLFVLMVPRTGREGA